MTDAPAVCGNCGARDSWAPPVTVIVVVLPGLKKRYPLIPDFDTDYRVCTHCKAIWRMIDRAVASCAATKDAGIWTEALVVCQDHMPVVKNQAATIARAALA